MKLKGRGCRAVMYVNRLSPEIYHRVGGRYRSLRSRQYSYHRKWRGGKNPTQVFR